MKNNKLLKNLGLGILATWLSGSAIFGSFVQSPQWLSAVKTSNEAIVDDTTIIIGNDTIVIGNDSTNIGWDTTNIGWDSTIIGWDTTNIGWDSTIIGYDSTINGFDSSQIVWDSTITNGGWDPTLIVLDSINNGGVIIDSTIIDSTVFTACHANFFMMKDSSGNGGWIGINLSQTDFSKTTFLWNFGDGSTSTAVFPKHVYATPGQYNICLTITNATTNCSDTKCLSTNIFKTGSNGSPLAGNSQVFSAISTYPNPILDNVTVSINAKDNADVLINVVDLFGKQVISQKGAVTAGSNAINLNTADLASGVYFISINDLTNQTTNTVKIIK